MRGPILLISQLALVIAALKLTGHLAWPWWLVLLPIWFSAVVVGVCWVVVGKEYRRRHRILRAMRRGNRRLENLRR